MNTANKITISRIVLAFIFMCFIFIHALWAKVLSLFIFILAALSDFLDGRIAQKRNMVTDFGKLMDPIADKILVITAYAVFVQMQIIEAWMVIIIISREIAITSLRMFALNKGRVLSAARAGKHKTASQMAVIFLILSFIVFKETMLTFFSWNPGWEKLFRQGIYVLMLITVSVTVYSGLRYLWDNRKIITSRL